MADITQTTYAEWTGDGVTRLYPVHFDYLSKSYVFLSVNGLNVPFTWITDGQVQATTAPAAGAKVRLYRRTDPQPQVAFTDTSTPTGEDLTTSYLHPLHLMQETSDVAAYGVEDAKAGLTSLEAVVATVQAGLASAQSSISGLMAANDTQGSALTALAAGLALETLTRINNDNSMRAAVQIGEAAVTFDGSGTGVWVPFNASFSSKPVVVAGVANGDVAWSCRLTYWGVTTTGFYVLGKNLAGGNYTGPATVNWVARRNEV